VFNLFLFAHWPLAMLTFTLISCKYMPRYIPYFYLSAKNVWFQKLHPPPIGWMGSPVSDVCRKPFNVMACGRSIMVVPYPYIYGSMVYGITP
jgi:hypothetical protein